MSRTSHLVQVVGVFTVHEYPARSPTQEFPGDVLEVRIFRIPTTGDIVETEEGPGSDALGGYSRAVILHGLIESEREYGGP